MPVRLVFDTMGTTVSLATTKPLGGGVQSQIRGIFDAHDARFSLYRPGSEGWAVASGLLELAAASAELRTAHRLARQWSAATHGAFTPVRPDGVLDLAGVVKAMAVQAAADVLLAHEVLDWCLNAGGDVLVNGSTADGRRWVVGIVDPDDRQALVTQYACNDAHPAVATSGTTERGEHVWRQRCDAGRSALMRPTAQFRQVTVAGPDIITADVLATAILAGGPRSLDRILATWPVEVFAAGADGTYVATTAFRRAPGRQGEEAPVVRPQAGALDLHSAAEAVANHPEGDR